jgi:undecaprenyl pyrophosphate phosphatase UppP
MTNAEMRQLAEIERRLTTEYPDLTRLFAEAAGRRPRARRRWELWAGILVAVVAAALLGVGLALGLPGLAVTAACPVVAYAVVLAGYWLAHGGWARLRERGPRRRH